MKIGVDIVSIAAPKDFSLALNGLKPSYILKNYFSVIVLGAIFFPEVLNNINEYIASHNAMLTEMKNGKRSSETDDSLGCKTKVISAVGGEWVDRD